MANNKESDIFDDRTGKNIGDAPFAVINYTHCCGPFNTSKEAYMHVQECRRIPDEEKLWAPGRCRICCRTELDGFFPGSNAQFIVTMPFGTKKTSTLEDLEKNIIIIQPLDYAHRS
ncbi:MAG: hypothetical protein UU67_C0009G0021 [Candidatus Daviesbacteria bacterium GW2011_GWB1_41_5]|uniref:Uncharacterized protein n=1 Tax=Candidatus Daviesbacteria bacterium GW2011_GWB1_41_5 TaxID=1618429 RepID=A0A0G0WMM4_9BACT|nr:MAG: hypothetical protein UU67_C0009G0021 [Candidatus Daviesbacteria bacterium GW2011_GWB1_41_5]